MAPTNGANNATITLTYETGNLVEFGGAFVITVADGKGNVTGAFTPATGGPAIVLIGKALIDGSIDFDLAGTEALRSAFLKALGLPADVAILYTASLAVAYPLAKAEVATLAKAVKAVKKADRDHRLAIQAEEAAKVDADTTSTNRGVLNRAIQLLADMQDVLDYANVNNGWKLTELDELKTVLAGLSLQVGANVITDLVTALNSDSNNEAEKLTSFRSAVTQATTDLATAKTSAESRDVAAQAKKVVATKQAWVFYKEKITDAKVSAKAAFKLINPSK